MCKVFVRKLPHAADLPLPAYMTAEAAGMDLLAANLEPLIVLAGTRVLVPTGLQLGIPNGYEAQVRPRSGLALKYGIGILNSPGTIDADYRGEIKIIVVNLGKEPYVISHGDRIAQLVLAKVVKATLMESSDLANSERGELGFGHTGV
ncbi:MAG: dUTP diphosphatase [Firmicutes bacterium]|nr:dUTP diphosphatase [Bacillota bacterium]